MSDNSLNITRPVDGTNNVARIIPADKDDAKKNNQESKKKKNDKKRTPINEELNDSLDELNNDGPGIDFHA